jgi:hypothetical protein
MKRKIISRVSVFQLASLFISVLVLSSSITLSKEPAKTVNSLFEVLQIEGESLVLKLRPKSGIHMLVLPDDLPLSPRRIDEGETLKLPLGVNVHIYERHHGVKLVPRKGESSLVEYQIESYVDERSVGGKLTVERQAVVAGKSSNGVIPLVIKNYDEKGRSEKHGR